MSTVTLPRRLVWQIAAVQEIRPETPRVKTVVLRVPDWPGHRAGQHLDVRLTAEDGYQAQRSYSIASAPEDPRVSITVEAIEDGEVSPYLTDVLQPGFPLELRGPVGGYFTWDVRDGGPLLLVAGGSGIVPLMAMLRHRAAMQSRIPARLLYSVRTRADLIYAEELHRLGENDPSLEIIRTLTRERPEGWSGYTRRIDREMLEAVSRSSGEQPRIFICGPTALVEAAATHFREMGHAPERIKTERFGPTGAP
jgi:ferredoxin-NADP reductase